MVKKTSLLKELIMSKEILVMPGAFDALSAKIIEQTGFKCTTLGGYPTSAVRLAKPDVSLLTMTEMVEHTRYIADAVDIPLLVDGDTGHGNVTNVIRTVRQFEEAGAAGLFLEDQVFPKRCGHMEGKQVIPTDEMVAKLKAAVDTRADQDFIIMARTDALAVYGIDEAIERGNRYREAGADLIFIEAPPSVEDMRRINREVNAPTSANMVEGGKTPIMSAKELEEIGYAVATFPLSALYAMAWAVRWVMGELSGAGTTKGCFERMTLFNEFNQIVGLRGIRDIETHYYQDLLGKKEGVMKGGFNHA
ncbi:MAG: 2,3-dimethylmalate lyase [Syntrophorhabdus sp. PtaU1.Bin058]|nr:MAG: 2,3-dimethylmalate lyase [Syntrophorhabdus sp. PtaU1.Bin058]